LPALSAALLPVRRGDILILASDGSRGEFARAVAVPGAAQKITDRILAENARTTDDALVLVSRRERLSALNGTLAITTGPGEGTTLDMRVPLSTT
jgi:hypothetical protein